MKPIKDRFQELKAWEKWRTNSIFGTMNILPTSNDYYMKNILTILNKEYFNDTLNIKWNDYDVSINNKNFNKTHELLDYLQNLYDLQCLKNKCQKILN